ncbi:hypothetical protein NIE88_11485 [Sporolactobacillus shoreicorticis]|uniref:Uncharacterized protein n=1 Tax=Sporolactobacillus shoreicorticis TaxID=1923877 RepID=A0ABW5S4J1_9BACL|nr:hypothetical protein [Sporolactobacillus shoreicorticis]MCO7126393.1 hypothetical protein [Sporolactobacillus shoreicorticis]
MRRLNFKVNKRLLDNLENKERRIDLRILALKNEIDNVKRQSSEITTRLRHSLTRVNNIENEINQYFNGDLL